MTQICRPAKCIEAIRVALLDQCTYLPVCGPLNGYAMGCIIDADWSPEIEEGDESVVKDGCGNICLIDQRCDQVKRYNLEFKIKDADKEFLSLILGDNLIVDDAVSVGVQHLNSHCSPWLFVELFERTDQCVNGVQVYFRHVFPAARLSWTGNEKEGVFRILQIEGKTKNVLLSNVVEGPYNDIPVYATAAPVGSRSDYFWFEDTTVPAVQCGSIEVPCVQITEEVCDQLTLNFPNRGAVDRVDFTPLGPGPVPFRDYYDPLGPRAGLNPPGATILVWTDTQIVVNDPSIIDMVIESICTEDVAMNSLYCDFVAPPFYEVFDCATLAPTLEFFNGEDCNDIRIDGRGYDQVDHIFFEGPNIDFYDPNGPNAGLNPVGTTFTFWNLTRIHVQSPGLGDTVAITGVHMWSLGDVDDWGSFPFVPALDGCVPTVTLAESTDCEQFHVEAANGGMFVVNHIHVGPGLGFDYYDPAGPDAGLNPGSATINTWTAHNIDITDINLVGTFSTIQFWTLGDVIDYGITVFPDVTVLPC